MGRRSGLCPLLLFAFLSLAAATDTTPPLLHVDGAQPFIFHVLVTVLLDEDGTVYCGALENTGSGTYVPSVYQMQTGYNLDSHGSETVSANTYANVLVGSLFPGTMYDIYCYAEDLMLNNIGVSGIAATLQSMVVTASGGDYTAPTFAYVAPYELIEGRTITVYVSLGEHGVVWCVALRDSGSGTTEPTSAQIINNNGVDSWGQASIEPQSNYESPVRLENLVEDTVYDVYCFAKDMSGNYLDGTPALTADPNAIANTKRAGLRTLAIYNATDFRVTTPAGVSIYTAEQASWNAYLLQVVISGSQERRDLESYSASPALEEAILFNLAGDEARAHGCAKLPVPPRGGGPFVALLRRGRCTFAEKAERASRAGYQAIVVIDFQAYPNGGILPDMTAEGNDSAMSIPAWIVGLSDGEAIVSAYTTYGSVTVTVKDVYRKPLMSHRQRDIFGFRRYSTK